MVFGNPELSSEASRFGAWGVGAWSMKRGFTIWDSGFTAKGQGPMIGFGVEAIPWDRPVCLCSILAVDGPARRCGVVQEHICPRVAVDWR